MVKGFQIKRIDLSGRIFRDGQPAPSVIAEGAEFTDGRAVVAWDNQEKDIQTYASVNVVPLQQTRTVVDEIVWKGE